MKILLQDIIAKYLFLKFAIPVNHCADSFYILIVYLYSLNFSDSNDIKMMSTRYHLICSIYTHVTYCITRSHLPAHHPSLTSYRRLGTNRYISSTYELTETFFYILGIILVVVTKPAPPPPNTNDANRLSTQMSPNNAFRVYYIFIFCPFADLPRHQLPPQAHPTRNALAFHPSTLNYLPLSLRSYESCHSAIAWAHNCLNEVNVAKS